MVRRNAGGVTCATSVSDKLELIGQTFRDRRLTLVKCFVTFGLAFRNTSLEAVEDL